MVTEKMETQCLLVEEAKYRGVIDSACSRTVAGVKWTLDYLNKLENYDEDEIEQEKSRTEF